MAKTKVKTTEQIDAEKTLSPKDRMLSYLKDNPDDHLNFHDQVNFSISSGSIILDIAIDGGLLPGAHRFLGARECGKTSAALSFAKNFQETVAKPFVVYVKAEGRLSENVIRRSGIDTSDSKWFVLESNIYEFLIDSMRDAVNNNPDGTNYLWIIDSVDALITREENAKSSNENAQPGTAAKKLKELFRKMGSKLSKLGHLAIFISQESAKIVIDKYAPQLQQQGNTVGGQNLQHSVDFALEYLPHWKSDLIFEDEEKKTGKILGHYCRVKLHKSSNESTGNIVSYPIKYGQIGGRSIWREREVSDLLLMFSHAIPQPKGVAWNVESALYKEVKTKFENLPEKFASAAKFVKFFEENVELSDFLWNRFNDVLLKCKSKTSTVNLSDSISESTL